MAAMETVTYLGKSSLVIPRMGMGVMTWGDARGLARLHPAKTAYSGPAGREEERQAFLASLDVGVNFFDTAAMYSGGASERRLGELARGQNVLIASKFPGTLSFRAEKFPDALEMSLERLGRTAIDLYQHHFPARSISIPQLMNFIADAVESGKIKAVGVSNYSAQEMRMAYEALAKRGIPLASNQVEYSLLHRQPETNGVLDACRELGITLIAYQPLASGLLTGKYTAAARPSGLRRFMPNFRSKALAVVEPVIMLLKQIGAGYSKTPGQVALRWLLENPLVLPIPGAKNSQQVVSNVDALTFCLTPAEIDALNQASLAWRG